MKTKLGITSSALIAALISTTFCQSSMAQNFERTYGIDSFNRGNDLNISDSDLSLYFNSKIRGYDYDKLHYKNDATGFEYTDREAIDALKRVDEVMSLPNVTQGFTPERRIQLYWKHSN